MTTRARIINFYIIIFKDNMSCLSILWWRW